MKFFKYIILPVLALSFSALTHADVITTDIPFTKTINSSKNDVLIVNYRLSTNDQIITCSSEEGDVRVQILAGYKGATLQIPLAGATLKDSAQIPVGNNVDPHGTFKVFFQNGAVKEQTVSCQYSYYP